MDLFNEYAKQIDFSPLKSLFLTKGKMINCEKKEYFIHQDKQQGSIGWMESGIFKYTRTNEEGNEHIVGYSFAGDFVCDYPSFIKHSLSLTSVQAVTDCTLYTLSGKELDDYWERDMNTQRLGRTVAQEMFSEVYQRLLSFYCDTPERRYTVLLQRCPKLLEYITLKDIASFIGVTPETVSHIRRKLLLEQKS